MIVGGRSYADHIIVHPRVIGEKLRPPNLRYSFGCLLSQGVVVAYQSVEAKGFMVLNAFLDAEIGGEVSRSSPVELSLWSLTVEVPSNCWLDDLSQLIIDVEEGSALGAEGPLMKIAKIGIRSNISDAEIDIAWGMSAINNEYNPFLLEELSQRLHWQGSPSGRTDVVQHNHLYLLGVAVHEILDLELEGLGRC